MSRIENFGNAAELAKSGILGCYMVDLDFASGHLYANDGFYEINYLGNVFTPLGHFGGIDGVQEGLDATARAIKLTLSGVDSSIVGKAENEIYQNRAALVYFTLIDQASGQLVGPPEIAWEGRMDYMTIDIDQGKGSVTLNCENRLRREPKIARYTDVDQQQLYPGDNFFNWTGSIAAFTSQWGNQRQTYGGPPYTYVYSYPVPR
jgi:hypothetical protein